MNSKKSTKSKPYFIQLVIQSKDDNDWRAFLYFKPEFNSIEEIELRGYGATMVDAARDAQERYQMICEE